jgi:4'-phosphopantetheinyl transferase
MKNLSPWELKLTDEKIILKENELHMWRTTLSDNEDNLDNYWNLLTQDEQIRAKEFYFSIDKNRYIVARAVLRKLIARYINVFPEDILFNYTEYGKPYLYANNPSQELKFNLAHSKNSIVYGFTKNIDVGVDIEFINRDFVIDNLVQYCCSKQEQCELLKLSYNQKHSFFYKLWVLKEAFVKAIGLGLSYDLRQVHIKFGKDDLIYPIDIINNNKINLTLGMFLSYNGYYSAFALRTPVKRAFFFTYQI